MYRNKILDKFNYPVNKSTSSFVFGMKNDKRQKEWNRQRRKWGNWDERVSWNLHTFLLESLYTWLKIYYKKTNNFIDLEYHVYEIAGKKLTQKECIKQMLNDLEYILLNIDNDEEFENVKLKVKNCFCILGECLFSLWW